MKRRILEHFGVHEKSTYINEQFKMYLQDIKNAIRDNEMIAISGKVGAGKTVLFRHALAAVNARPDNQTIVVRVQNKYKEVMTISSILNAIIYDISDEAPRRDLEARSRQVIRLLGKKHVQEGRNVAIIIEESHRMHFNTFRAIKELREDEFAGVAPLFSVVLIGHEELVAKLQMRKEVYWRSLLLELSDSRGWMNFTERVKYLGHIYGDAITGKARERIASLYRVPLELDYFVERKMEEAYQAGFRQLDESCFDITVSEMLNALNEGLSSRDEEYVSLDKISKESGLGKTTVHDALKGQSPRNEIAVKAALQRLAEKRAEQSNFKQAANY